MTMNSMRRVLEGFVTVVALALTLPIMCVVVYVVTRTAVGWDGLGLALLVMSAAYLSGGLLGFLFAVPRSDPAAATGNGPAGARLVGTTGVWPNKNLEDVSDWLTKVVVGLTLIELKTLPAEAADLFEGVGVGLGGGDEATLLAGALIIYSAAAGLMEAWLATRLFITGWMAQADAGEAIVVATAHRNVKALVAEAAAASSTART